MMLLGIAVLLLLVAGGMRLQTIEQLTERRQPDTNAYLNGVLKSFDQRIEIDEFTVLNGAEVRGDTLVVNYEVREIDRPFTQEEMAEFMGDVCDQAVMQQMSAMGASIAFRYATPTGTFLGEYLRKC